MIPVRLPRWARCAGSCQRASAVRSASRSHYFGRGIARRPSRARCLARFRVSGRWFVQLLGAVGEGGRGLRALARRAAGGSINGGDWARRRLSPAQSYRVGRRPL